MNAAGPEPAQMVRGIAEIRSAAPDFLSDLRDQYGKLLQFPIPKPLTYLVSDPAWVDYVLRTNAKNYGKATIQYRTLALVTGYGLLAADNTAWREQRRMLQPAFHHDVVAGVVQHSVAATSQVLSKLDNYVNTEIDLDHEMMQLALNVVGSALFGSDFQLRAKSVVSATLKGLDVVVSRARTPIFPPKWVPTPLNLKLQRANKTLERAVDQIVTAAEQTPQLNTISQLLVTELSAGNITRSQVRDELVTFIVAGHETVASALSWALHLLSLNQDVQHRLAAEAVEVLGQRDPEFADYAKLKYAKAVFNEAMRLYPPAWVLTRNAIAADEIDGVEIAPGSLIVISPWVVHRDKTAWPDPTKFDPDRFLTEDRIPSGAFIPFGLGNRMCIGRDFAMFEGVIALAMLARKFKFDPVNKILPLPSVTVRPKHGLLLKLSAR
jgi:cytochrome P450